VTTLSGRRLQLATLLAFVLALAATVPTAGDFGLTYDEPAYRYSQMVSAQWWERLARAHSITDIRELLEPNTLLYYWPYGRHGINFHPPLAGQLNLLTYATFGHVMKDIPARRMSSVLEFSLTLTILFGFLARRYGAWVGGVAAGALLFMPRLYGQAHLAETDTPGLFLWAATTVAFWKGLYEPQARRWRILVGVLLGLAFVEKMGAVMVLLPVLAWLALARLPRALARSTRADWTDGLITTALQLVPLGLAYLEMQRLSAAYLQLQTLMGVPLRAASPARTNLFRDHPPSVYSGLILAVPLLVWLVRRGLARLFPKGPVWGVERPALETLWTILAFAPVVGWLGNPAWWRETLPRLAHYYTISTAREGVLPGIQVLYFGQIYEYSLPWHNAWVLIGITVPVTVLAASVVGLLWGLGVVRRDLLPLYFLVHLLVLPALRMLNTPAHDGVRLFLPAFFLVAAFAGWGTVALADLLARVRPAWRTGFRTVLAAIVLAPAAWDLVRIHPFELSYFNAVLGGPGGAWRAGFELTYWYDAFDPQALREINALDLPAGTRVTFPNDLSKPVTFEDLQSLGMLRGDIHLGDDRTYGFPYLWLLTHDSKAMAYTRFLFEMRPVYERRPTQLGGLRVAALMSPEAASRSLALQLLSDAPDRTPVEVPRVPAWVRWIPKHEAWLGRFWGEGLKKIRKLTVNEPILTWARTDPGGLRAAARTIVTWALSDPDGVLAGRSALARPPFSDHPDAARLFTVLTRYDRDRSFSANLLRSRPEALAEAVEILIRHPDEVRRVLTRPGFTDPSAIGGYLDRDLRQSE
jgi:4-amino-4-deoxy-L-arabinose transferase-like glycosyltransferase